MVHNFHCAHFEDKLSPLTKRDVFGGLLYRDILWSYVNLPQLSHVLRIRALSC